MSDFYTILWLVLISFYAFMTAVTYAIKRLEDDWENLP